MMEKKKRRYEQPTAAAVRIEHDIYLLAVSGGETTQGRDTRPAKTNPFADDDNIDQWADASQD